MVISSQKITKSFSRLATRVIGGVWLLLLKCMLEFRRVVSSCWLLGSLLAFRVGFRVSVVYVNDVANTLMLCVLCSVLLAAYFGYSFLARTELELLRDSKLNRAASRVRHSTDLVEAASQIGFSQCKSVAYVHMVAER